MAKVFIEESSLTAIGDAIRGKTGQTGMLTVPDGMVEAINSIETGVVGEKQTMTITENGTYTIPEGIIVTAITVNVPNGADPSAPEHEYADMFAVGIGETFEIKRATGDTISVTSYSKEVLSLTSNSNGIITFSGKAVGTCVITVFSALYGTLEYYVEVLPSKGVKVGSTVTITLTDIPYNDAQVTIEDPTLLSYNINNGISFTGLQVGLTTVIISNSDGSIVYIYRFTVRA